MNSQENTGGNSTDQQIIADLSKRYDETIEYILT
jgi:hypothetical protein